MLIREKYLSKIRPFYNNELIKVLIGIRRSGKSVIMKTIKNELLDSGVPSSNILYINMESFQFDTMHDYRVMHKYVSKKLSGINGKKYLFIDEVQIINKFEVLINSFRVDFDDISIFITGSNSNLLSGELATLLTGRYISFNIFPFDYLEYADFTKQNKNAIETFENYIRYGGFPQVAKIEDAEEKIALLDDLVASIALKDILARTKEIEGAQLLEGLLRYMISQSGNTFSIRSITNYLNTNVTKTSEATVKSYLDAMLNSMIINECERYDIKGKKTLKREEKYYAIEHGLMNAISNYSNGDSGRVLETIVYNYCVSKGYRVFVGKLKDGEVDFVIRKHEDLKYIQVAYYMGTNETVEREFTPLEKIKDNYEKIVLSLDPIDMSRNGVKHINVIKFLTGNILR